MDTFDAKILWALSENGRATQAEIGEATNLSGTAAGRRQKILEEQGFILGYRAILNLASLGFASTVMVLIQLDRQSSATLANFEKAIFACPSVVSCHLLSGSEDYLVILRVRDLADFERVHRVELSQLPGVSRMQSLFSLREVVSRPVPPALFSC